MSQKASPIVGVPAILVFRSTPCRWIPTVERNKTILREGERVHPVKLYERMKNITKAEYFDAWQVRQAFLEVKGNKEMVQFLNKTGLFSHSFKKVWGYEEMRGWQEIFNMMLQKDPIEWVKWLQDRQLQYKQHLVAFIAKHHEMTVSFRWKKDQNTLAFSANDTLTAIYTTVVLDKLAGSRFRLCERKDCRKPFKIESHHNRKYCDPYCAHIEVIRRGRERKRQEKKPGKRKRKVHIVQS